MQMNKFFFGVDYLIFNADQLLKEIDQNFFMHDDVLKEKLRLIDCL